MVLVMIKDLETAKNLFHSGQYTCVLCKGDVIYTSKEPGIKPLLGWIDDGTDLKEFAAVDKIVGRAASFLYLLLGVKEVHASVMSEGAVRLLTDHGIPATYEECVEHIVNRAKTGICPMEEAVWEICEPEEALQALRKKVQDMKKS
jgi:hypothetical protein